MKISTRELDGIVIANLEGRLESSTAGYVSDGMVRLSKGEGKRVLVNLEKLEFIICKQQ